MNEITFKLKGNESFNIREGWLSKGIEAIRDDPYIFTQSSAMDTLGVGSKMVKSIRFWMQATGLAQETRENGKRRQTLTEGFGEIIAEKDPYFEDVATLWLIHSKIIVRKELCTAWYFFFNTIEATEFDRDDLIMLLGYEMNKLVGHGNYSAKSLEDDCVNIIRMYLKEDLKTKGLRDPEENLSSPFSELGLIQKSEVFPKKYKKTQPIQDSLDKLVVMYVLLGSLGEGQHAVSVDDLLYKPCSIGKTLNMGRTMLYEYLDKLRNVKLITLNRTAGLDMVYVPEDLHKVDILRDYYR